MCFARQSVRGNVCSGRLSDKKAGSGITDAKSLLSLKTESDVRFLPRSHLLTAGSLKDTLGSKALKNKTTA